MEGRRGREEEETEETAERILGGSARLAMKSAAESGPKEGHRRLLRLSWGAHAHKQNIPCLEPVLFRVLWGYSQALGCRLGLGVQD